MKPDALVVEATRCGIAPLLYEWAKNNPYAHGLSSEDLETLRDVYFFNALRNGTIRQELSEVLGTFRSDGIPVIALKGAHLVELVYGSPALRPMADLDLLVREGDLACAERCLRGLGYRPVEGSGPDRMDYSHHHHLRPFVKPGAVPIEIHRNLATDSGLLKVVADLLWERAHDAVLAGVPAKVLCPEHLLLHLCLHTAYSHRFMFSLLHLCDISWSAARYRQQIDWPCVAAIAKEWGASRLVYSTLLLVEETLGLGIEPPRQLEALFRHEDADREIVATLRELLFTPWQELPFAYRELGECHGFRHRIRTLTRNLFPEPTRMCQIYGLPTDDPRMLLYYFFRPVDLLVRRGRFVLELICRGERIRPALEQEEKRLQIHRWLEECLETQPGE